MQRALLIAGLSLLAFASAAPPAAAACNFQKIAEIPVTMTGAGPTVALKINGQDARLIADSGAFFSMLTPESARRLGLPPSAMPHGANIMGVNGRSHAEVSEARQMAIADAPFRNVDFLVGGGMFPGGLDGVLGESFLGSMDVEYDLGHGLIRLFKPQGCSDEPLVYWNGDRPYSVLKIERPKYGPHDVEARARLNGSDIHVILDTGAWRSILTSRAAAQAGVSADGPGVEPAGFTGGIGHQPRATWMGRFDSFAIGDEDTKDARLPFGDVTLGDADMLLGADFFLAHRVLVANSQHRVYFTSEDGQMFRPRSLPQQGPPN